MHIIIPNIKQQTKGGKSLQNHWNNCEELSIASELLSMVNLLPPCQAIIDSLIITKRGSFFPVEEVVSYLHIETKLSCQREPPTDHQQAQKVQF